MVGGEANYPDELWDEEKMLDIYIYDYFCKRQFMDCATLFNIRTRVSQEKIDVDTPESFLKEWWLTFWNSYVMSGTPRPPEEYIDAENMLHACIFDHLIKRGYDSVAARLSRQTNCCQQKIEVDIVDGFLKDWWSIFWEVYSARRQRNSARRWTGDELERIYPPEKKYHRFCQPVYAVDIAAMPGQPRIAISQQLMQEKFGEINPMSEPLDLQGDCSGPAPSVMEAQVQNEMNFCNYQQQQNEPFTPDSQFHRGNYGDRMIYSDPVNNFSDVRMLNNVQMTQMDEEEMRRAQDDELMILHEQQIYPSTPYSQFQGGNSDNDINYNNPINDLNDVQIMRSIQMTRTAEEEARKKKEEERLKLFADIKNMVNMAKNSNGLNSASMKPRTQIIGKETEYPVRRKTKRQREQDNQKSQLHKTANVEVVDENVELNISHNDENKEIANNTLAALQTNSLSSETSEPKGFSLEQIGCTNMAKKVVCCHFSSDGKYLVSGGQEKQVLLWGTENSQPTKMDGMHSGVITDVRFRPNSDVFATSSFDKTIQIWEASKSRKSLLRLEGHTEKVTSLDFHPKKTDILCSCDSNDEIRLWNVNNPFPSIRSFKGGNRKIRFQPQSGRICVAASGSIINMIDVETCRILHKFEGHNKAVQSLCWDIHGNRFVSVSEDSARVWCVNSLKCEQQLNSNGNKFASCSFHPSDSQLIYIGSYQSLIQWNTKENNKTAAILAHGGLLSCIAVSSRTGMIASTSYDNSVKLWR